METMTVRQLRQVLFYVHNQDMTVRELRALLFQVEDQEAHLVPSFDMWLKTGIEVDDADNKAVAQ